MFYQNIVSFFVCTHFGACCMLIFICKYIFVSFNASDLVSFNGSFNLFDLIIKCQLIYNRTVRMSMLQILCFAIVRLSLLCPSLILCYFYVTYQCSMTYLYLVITKLSSMFNCHLQYLTIRISNY